MAHTQEISLTTNDGKSVHIADFYLRAHSPVVRDMFAVASLDGGDKESIVLDIDIDLESAGILVNYLHHPHIDVKLTSYAQAKGLLKACDFLALETLRKSVLLNLESLWIFETDIWDAFCLAARYDAPKVAQHALAAISQNKLHPLYTDPTAALTKEMAEACETRYLLGYFHAVCEAVQGAYKRGGPAIPWLRVAELFEPHDN